MAYKITDDCISCGSCAATCPVEAISEGAEHYEIDADKCVECVLALPAARYPQSKLPDG